MSGVVVDHTNLWRIDPKMLCNYSMIRDSTWACGWGWGCHDRFKPNSKFPNTFLTMAFSKDLNTSSARDELFLDTVVTTNGYHFTTQDSIFDTHHQDNYSQYYQPVEDPWLSLPLPLPHPFSHPAQGNDTLSFVETASLEEDAMYHHIDVDACVSDRDHPVEDPWLLYPTLEPSDPDAVSVSEIGIISEIPQDTQNLVNLQEHPHQVSDNLLSGKESNVHSKQATVSTEILINCSVCTMQRIAVLEDGNLVELLLEPVKTNVQCDSVYLGVVTKLVPHMGGAFVNIGSSRPSLMDINSTREPFLFFPFDTTKGSDVNGSSSWIVGKNSDSNQIRKELLKEDDAELSDVDTEVDFEDDDFAEHENEDDLDVQEVVNSRSTVVSDCGSGENVGGSTYRLNGNVKNEKVQPDVHVSSVQGDKTTQSPRAANEIWALVRKGTKIVVQVVKEGLGTKGPTLTAYPKLRSRFWVLITRCNRIGVSKKISGVERTRLRVIAKSLQPPGFGVTVRTVAAGRSVEELKKDLEGLLSTWRHIMEDAKSAALAADEGVEGAVPVILHQAMGQTLSVVQDYFGEKVKRMVVDSPRTYHEVTNYLQDIAPDLCDRVELHRKKVPLFDEFNLEEEINNILNKRVSLPNGGSLVIEQTEALVSIDVNGGHGMFGQGASQEKAIVDVNLAAAKQIARELRLRDIGGIIVVDFIDMMDDSNKRLIYEEIKKAVERDRSVVKVSELSKHGLMEITRKRVRPSVTFMISEPCTCCHGTGRIEALETSFSKIEHEICSLLATMDQKADPESPKSWPRLLLRVDAYMCDYLTSGKKTRLATLSSSLKVWILLKVARSFTRGAFELKLLADEKANNDHQESGVFMLPLGTETSKLTKRTKLFPVKKWKAGRKG